MMIALWVVGYLAAGVGTCRLHRALTLWPDDIMLSGLAVLLWPVFLMVAVLMLLGKLAGGR